MKPQLSKAKLASIILNNGRLVGSHGCFCIKGSILEASGNDPCEYMSLIGGPDKQTIDDAKQQQSLHSSISWYNVKQQQFIRSSVFWYLDLIGRPYSTPELYTDHPWIPRPKWRTEIQEAVRLMDIYEIRLIVLGDKATQAQRRALLDDLIARLEEMDVIEWVDEKSPVQCAVETKELQQV